MDKKQNAGIQSNLGIYQNITATIRDAVTGEIVSVYRHKNLVALVGLSVVAQRLANNLANTLVINYGALGTDTTAPTQADTQLGTEVFRKAPLSQSDDDNVCNIGFFYTAGEVSGTFREFGTFIDGTGSANTGVLFNKVAVNWVKSSSETLTVDVENTVN